MMTKKILFLHGFFASGSCIPAQTLKQAFVGKAEVFTPDLPLHPKKALAFIENICQQEKPCVLVGNSNGAFLAQIAASRLGLPALLGNPYLEMTRFLTERIGPHEYKSPRVDRHRQASTFHNRPIPHRGVCRGTSPPMGCLPTGTG